MSSYYLGPFLTQVRNEYHHSKIFLGSKKILISGMRPPAGGSTPRGLQRVKQVARKIAVLGYRTVGKTALTTHFVQERFVEHYDPTIESTFHKTVIFPRLHIFTEIVDSAGMDEYSRLSRNASVGVHGYLLLYSTTSRSSFEKIQAIDDVLVEMHGGGADSVARVLVGTMIDAEGRQVSYDEGLSLAERRGVPFIECSARENINVREVFTMLLREAERDTVLHDSNIWNSVTGFEDCTCSPSPPPLVGMCCGGGCGGGGGDGGGGSGGNGGDSWIIGCLPRWSCGIGDSEIR